MEKRLLLFIVVAMLILWGWLGIQKVLNLNPQPDPPVAQAPEDGDEPQEGEVDDTGDPPPATVDSGSVKPNVDVPPEPNISAEPTVEADTQTDVGAEVATHPQRWDVLGSAAAGTPYRMMVICNSQGGTIETVELTERNERGGYRYRDLLFRSGYFGALGIRYEEAGARVNVVPPATAASQAVSAAGPTGLMAGDLITSVAGKVVSADSMTIDDALEKIEPGEDVELVIERDVDGATTSLNYVVTLSERPLPMMQPEAVDVGKHSKICPLSMLLSVEKIGKTDADLNGDIANLPSLRSRIWEAKLLEGGNPGIEYRIRLTAAELKEIGEQGPIEFVKRFRLTRPSDDPTEPGAAGYHLDMEVEVVNLSTQPTDVSYRLAGPTGLPLEGWWYSNKIHPTMFYVAGARDIRYHVDGHLQRVFMSASTLQSTVSKNEEGRKREQLASDATLKYLAVDAQYFSVAMQQAGDDPNLKIRNSYGLPMGAFQGKKGRNARKTNVTFEAVTPIEEIPPESSSVHKYRLFVGPKDQEVLADYQLTELTYYGWPVFAFFSTQLAKLLGFFAWLTGNYGLAIMMLTLLVRMCLWPLSRKAAKNAAMMQQLSPEIKRISEKYKEDAEKLRAAQQDLFKKHNYNPLGGCWVMFVQLPIFLGLYKCLSVDIHLRQAPLIPGVDWCSNLAGPDMLYDWSSWMPAWFADPATGWLGPYFNILPVITCCLFLVQQKLFTPPATDEQTAMQQKMMKFMMIFMGVMFFRVAAGLCIYFIMSTMWGIAERKLLPKPAPESLAKPTEDVTDKKPGLMDRLKDAANQVTNNGSSEPTDPRELRKRRKKRK